jgi:dienelactone hydrolase
MAGLRWGFGRPLTFGVWLLVGVAFAQVPSAEDRARAGVGGPVAELTPAKDLTPKQRAAREEAWRKEIRRALFVPDMLPALEAKTWSSFSPTPGVVAERVTYSTADGMIVPAIVYRPEKWQGKLPGIVVVNGHGGDKFSWYAFYSGMMFARAGAMVVTYDPIGEGERNIDKKSRAASHDKQVDTPHWGQRLAGLMQVDVMQAVSYLAQRPEVDAKRIATVGYSMGSFITGITGAIDTRIHAVLLSGGGVYDGPGGYFDMNPLPCQRPPYKALSVLGDRGAVLFALNAARGPMLVMNGADDKVMDIPHHPQAWFDDVRARAVALRGTDKDMFTTIFYPGVDHRTSWVDRQGVEWLEKQIHFAIWTEKEIATAPVTHVSTWAKANGVDITPNYMREDREGGLDAVGTGFPGIRHEDLMVLPAAEWEREKDRLTYEAWAEKTLQAERAGTQ